MKLGSPPSYTDSRLVFTGESKIKLPNKHGTKLRWISGVFGFSRELLAQEFNTTHCHVVWCQHRETRFWEFPTFQWSLARGRWWGSPKRRLVWELEALFGIPTKFNHSLQIWGMSHFEFHIHFKDIKSFSGYMASSIKKCGHATSSFLT